MVAVDELADDVVVIAEPLQIGRRGSGVTAVTGFMTTAVALRQVGASTDSAGKLTLETGLQTCFSTLMS